MRDILKLGSRGLDVFDWQFVLTEWCKLRGVPPVISDGFFGPKTEAITMQWQIEHCLTSDGIVGQETWTAAEGQEEEPIMATIVNVTGIDRLSVKDIKALISAANWLGINPDWLAAVISFETAGTFDPAKKNAAGSGATGLIQFMPATAKRLGTTTDLLSRMSFIQQLEYVKKYFAEDVGVRNKMKSLEDVYLAVFYPAYISRKPTDVIASEGTKVYEQNRGFDKADKGFITRADVTSTIVSKLNSAIKSPRIAIPIIGTGAAVAAGAIGYGAYQLYKLRSS